MRGALVVDRDAEAVLPVWELEFGSLAQDGRAIATERVKHNTDYQERRGVLQGPAEGLPNGLETRIKNTVKRICRTLEIDGYARIDFRLSKDGVPYFIDANPNPEIARSQEFAESAKYDGLEYPDLLNRILALGLSRAGTADTEA